MATEKSYSENVWVNAAIVEFSFQESPEHKKELEESFARIESLTNALYVENQPSSVIVSFFGFGSSGKDEELAKLDRFLQASLAFAYYHLGYSLYQFRIQKQVVGAYHFRKSWKYFEEAQSVASTMRGKGGAVDENMRGLIAFGHGLFHFVVSLIPPSLQTIATIIGFQASREQSYAELQACVDSGCLKANEAALIVQVLKRFFLDELAHSDTLLARMQAAYPDSVLVCYLSAFQYRFGGQLDLSLKFWQKIHDTVTFSQQLQGTTRYHMGYCYFLQGEWQNAARCYEDFLALPLDSTGSRFRSYTAFQLGFCYWQLGQRDKVAPLYSRLGEWFRNHESYDIFAKRKIDKFLKTGKFNRAEELIIVANAYNEGKLFDKAEATAEELMKEVLGMNPPNAKELTALYHFLKGTSLFGKKDFGATKMELMMALESDFGSLEEKYIVPYSFTMLAEMAIELGNWAQASYYLKKVRSFKGYDWEKILAFRVYGDEQRLKRREKESEGITSVKE